MFLIWFIIVASAVIVGITWCIMYQTYSYDKKIMERNRMLLMDEDNEESKEMLRNSIKSGDLWTIKYFNKNTDWAFNIPIDGTLTPIDYAVLFGKRSIITYLLTNIPNINTDRIMSIAIGNNDYNLVREIDALNVPKGVIMNEAILSYNLVIIKFLYNRGYHFDYNNEMNKHMFSEQKYYDVFKWVNIVYPKLMLELIPEFKEKGYSRFLNIIRKINTNEEVLMMLDGNPILPPVPSKISARIEDDIIILENQNIRWTAPIPDLNGCDIIKSVSQLEDSLHNGNYDITKSMKMEIWVDAEFGSECVYTVLTLDVEYINNKMFDML